MFTEHNISGQVFRTVEEFTFRYGELVFNALAHGFLGIFGVCFALYLMLQLFQQGVIKGEFPFTLMFSPAITCTMVGLALADFRFLSDWLFTPLYKMSTDLALKAVTLSNRDLHPQSIMEMLNIVEQSLDESVFKVCRVVMRDAGWFSAIHTFAANLIIQGTFTFVWFLFLALMIDSLFKYMTVFATAPLLVISLAFPATKSIGMTGLRILLNALVTMFLAGIAMGFTILVMKLSGLSPLDQNGNITMSDWAFSRSYWAFFLVGLVSVYFHLKVPKLAANFSSIDDGAGVAGAVAGIGTMAVMGAKGGIEKFAGGAFDKATKYGKQGAKWVWDKLRSR